MPNNQKGPLFPSNRQEVFFDLLHFHKLELEKNNLWCLLFAFPSIALIYAYYIFSGLLPSLISKGTIALPVVEGETISEALFLFQIRNVLFAVLFLTNILLFVGLGGLFNVSQKLVFAENVDVKADFFSGLKKNAKDYILYSLIFSLVAFFANFVISFYSFDLSSWASIVSIVIASLVILFALFLLSVCLPFANLYQTPFFRGMKYSYAFFFYKFFRNFGFLLLEFWPLAFLFIPSLWFASIFGIVLVFAYLPYWSVIAILNVDYLGDTLVNEESFKELVNKGMKKRDNP
jgi:hypothetical protein